MIRAIFFDLDGVLTTDASGSLTLSKNICEESPGLSVQEVRACFRQFIEPLNLGKIPLKKVWDKLCRTFNIADDEDTYQRVLRKTQFNEPMMQLARALARRYTLGIITDNSGERMAVLTKEYSLGELFNPIIVSANVHAAKFDGTTRIFDAALAASGWRAEESLFIDNQQKNLVTPAEMGMKTYFHDDVRNDVAALRRALQQWGVNMQ